MLIFCGLSVHLTWRFYKNNITKLGCAVADKYCSIAGEGDLCDFYRKKKYDTFCLPPADIDEWLEYRYANQDVLDASLSSSDVIEMMRQGKFEELEHYFLDVQSRYENHNINELTYQDMMESLIYDNEEAVALYGVWLKEIPDSYIARYGRGGTNTSIGWDRRGEKWAKDTPKENWDAMRRYHLKAADDLRAAVALHPQLTMGYRGLVSMNNHGSKEHWLAESLKYDSYNYLVRKAYMLKLRPRWGGSHQKMHEFASSALKYIDKNPYLRGLPLYEFTDKAKVYRHQGRYAEAIEAGSTAIYHRPAETSYYTRAYAYEKEKKDKEAVMDAEKGLRQAPDNIGLLQVYAWSAREDQQYEKADDGYERLTRLRPDKASYWYSRGLLHYRLKKYVTTMQYWKKAHELDPPNNKYLYWFALAAIRNEVPAGLVKMRSFLERCKDSKCRQTDVSWARRWIDCVDGKPKCDLPNHDYIGWQKSPLYSP